MKGNEYILAGPIAFAMFRAAHEFRGRNWRRIKREINKAARRAKRRANS